MSFATVSRVFQESRSPPRGEPRVGGLQYRQLYPGTSFHVGTVDRRTVFDSGTANRAGFLPGIVAGQVVLLVLVPVMFPLGTCTDSPGAPSRRQADRHEGHTFDGYVT